LVKYLAEEEAFSLNKVFHKRRKTGDVSRGLREGEIGFVFYAGGGRTTKGIGFYRDVFRSVFDWRVVRRWVRGYAF
jgi:hypothetical protein